jgi:hypothetical protein
VRSPRGHVSKRGCRGGAAWREWLQQCLVDLPYISERRKGCRGTVRGLCCRGPCALEAFWCSRSVLAMSTVRVVSAAAFSAQQGTRKGACELRTPLVRGSGSLEAGYEVGTTAHAVSFCMEVGEFFHGGSLSFIRSSDLPAPWLIAAVVFPQAPSATAVFGQRHGSSLVYSEPKLHVLYLSQAPVCDVAPLARLVIFINRKSVRSGLKSASPVSPVAKFKPRRLVHSPWNENRSVV